MNVIFGITVPINVFTVQAWQPSDNRLTWYLVRRNRDPYKWVLLKWHKGLSQAKQ